MLLLGLDTATPAVTVALHDGGQPLAQLVTVDAHRHAELLAPAIAKVIADAGASQRDLTGIVAGVGPGPYTGLRVGLVTARVLGAALDIPVYGLCTLDVIAADVDAGGGEFLVATDARRRELYWASYDGSGRRDIWDNQADVFASIANYLAAKSWPAKPADGAAAVAPPEAIATKIQQCKLCHQANFEGGATQRG